MKTSKPLLTLRMLFPAAVSLIVLLLGEWIARGSLTADTFISFIFPHFGAYLLAWLLLFLVWELLDWVLRIPPLATLGMAVLGCAPCAVNFYTMQLRGEPFLPWDLMQVSEAAGVASAAGPNLEIDKPEGYSEQAVDDILDNVAESEKFSTGPMYAGSYAATTPKEEQAKQPTIIYVMDESYWDVSELEQYGITFDTDVSQNLHALQQTSAYGRAYSPSFGGGTCDVEFEALTGYSVSFLPSGSKPYQQHVTKPMFALPNYLKLKGYQTAAVHCFWAKYWSRDKAYPNLGFSDFISLEDMHGVTKVRKHYWTSGLVTDDSMADQIIQQYEKMSTSSDKPIFLHAVTMQNHTNYNRDNYPDDERVHIVSHPVGLKSSTVGALEDFATGIRDADAMLGKLTAYFSQVDEPVILVFWGDHYNPIDSNYDVYTTTGYASGSSTDPRLHQTTLLMWSNYSQQQVDLGTIAAYDISPVMMELFGLEQPLYFQFLNRQLRVASRSCTRGTTMNLDGTTTQQPTEFQQRWTNEHWMLQYDLMFGKGYALNRMGVAGLSGMNTGK